MIYDQWYPTIVLDITWSFLIKRGRLVAYGSDLPNPTEKAPEFRFNYTFSILLQQYIPSIFHVTVWNNQHVPTKCIYSKSSTKKWTFLFITIPSEMYLYVSIILFSVHNTSRKHITLCPRHTLVMCLFRQLWVSIVIIINTYSASEYAGIFMNGGPKRAWPTMWVNLLIVTPYYAFIFFVVNTIKNTECDLEPTKLYKSQELYIASMHIHIVQALVFPAKFVPIETSQLTTS